MENNRLEYEKIILNFATAVAQLENIFNRPDVWTIKIKIALSLEINSRRFFMGIFYLQFKDIKLCTKLLVPRNGTNEIKRR